MSSRSGRSHSSESRLYVGNLPQFVRESEIEDIFYKYGRVTSIDIHNRYNPAFAFIEFDDERDAKDAIHGRDGYDVDGYKIRVQYPKQNDRGGGGSRGGFSRGGMSSRDRGGRFDPPRRSDYRVLVSGLPATGSWQDLKDHMREAGDVLFTDVFRDGTGVVEYSKYDDMKWAVKNLDDTKFRSHENETSYISVKSDAKAGSRSRSKSRSRSFSRDNVYGSRSKSKSRSRSPRGRKSRSRSRSAESRSRSRSR